MKLFSLNQVFRCHYCDAKQPGPAKDFVPSLGPKQYSTAPTVERCTACDELFHVRHLDGVVVTDNNMTHRIADNDTVRAFIARQQPQHADA